MQTLKPCPFCGLEPETTSRNFAIGGGRGRLGVIYYAVWCSCCEYYGPPGRSKELAIQAWNARECKCEKP